MSENKHVLDNNDASLTLSKMKDVRPTLHIPERRVGAADQRLMQMDKQRIERTERTECIDEVRSILEFGDETAECQLNTKDSGKKIKDTRANQEKWLRASFTTSHKAFAH